CGRLRIRSGLADAQVRREVAFRVRLAVLNPGLRVFVLRVDDVKTGPRRLDLDAAGGVRLEPLAPAVRRGHFDPGACRGLAVLVDGEHGLPAGDGNDVHGEVSGRDFGPSPGGSIAEPRLIARRRGAFTIDRALDDGGGDGTLG